MTELQYDRQIRAIFVSGHARSGTSLFQSLFDGHPDLFAIPDETAFFLYYYQNRKIRDDYQRFLRIIGQGWDGRKRIAPPILEKGKNWRALRYYRLLEQADPNVEKKLIPYVKGRDPIKLFLKILDLLLENYWKKQDFPKAFVEKSPGHEIFFPWLRRAFPDLKFLYIVRNPFHVIHSNAIKAWRVRGQVSNRDIFSLISSWRISCYLGRTYAARHPNQFHVVRFEDLVSDTEKAMRQITGHLELDFDRSLLMPTQLDQPWDSNTHQGTPLAKGAIDPRVLKKDVSNGLTRSQIELIEKLTLKERLAFDYPAPEITPQSGENSASETARPIFLPKTLKDLAIFASLYLSPAPLAAVKTTMYKAFL